MSLCARTASKKKLRAETVSPFRKMGPGDLREDARFLCTISDGLEGGQRLPVEVERLFGGAASGRELGEAAQREARALQVVVSTLDLERLREPRLRLGRIARDGMEHSLEGQSDCEREVEAVRPALLDPEGRPAKGVAGVVAE